MLAFLSLFLKFYLADTPHRRNAKHFGGWLCTVTLFCITGMFAEKKIASSHEI